MYKNLLERARPELKKAITAFGVEYPNSATYLEKKLEETIGVSYLPYGVVLDLESIAGGANIEFSSAWDLFEKE